MKRIFGACLCLSLGCAPPLGRMLERRQFANAMCAAEVFSRDPERAKDRVRARVNAVARPRLHLHAVPKAELVASLGDAGALLAEQAVVVRALVSLDEIDVDDFQMSVALVDGVRTLEPWAPTRERLAGLMGEGLPQPVVEVVPEHRRLNRDRLRAHPLMGVTALVFEASTLFAVPLTEMTGHIERVPETRSVTDPTAAELAAAAPHTEAMLAKIQELTYRTGAVGGELSMVWLWPRTRGGAEQLHVHWMFSVHDCAGKSAAMRKVAGESATLVGAQSLPLPQAADLESRINARFGDQMLMLTNAVQ
ncbi:MAG: hypothetical protein AAF721_37960 [Myxococcota bacterium]